MRTSTSVLGAGPLRFVTGTAEVPHVMAARPRACACAATWFGLGRRLA